MYLCLYIYAVIFLEIKLSGANQDGQNKEKVLQ